MDKTKLSLFLKRMAFCSFFFLVVSLSYEILCLIFVPWSILEQSTKVLLGYNIVLYCLFYVSFCVSYFALIPLKNRWNLIQQPREVIIKTKTSLLKKLGIGLLWFFAMCGVIALFIFIGVFITEPELWKEEYTKAKVEIMKEGYDKARENYEKTKVEIKAKQEK